MRIINELPLMTCLIPFYTAYPSLVNNLCMDN